MQSEKKALEIQNKEERCRVKEWLGSVSQEEVVDKILQLEHSLLWREFRYKHDKNNKDVVGYDMNPRNFKMLTREGWK